MNRNDVKSFFAACVQPHGHFGIGEADAVGHEQEQAVGSRAKAVVCRPRPCDQNHKNHDADCDHDTAAGHRLITTSPCSRAHKVPNTTAPSSTSIRGALTVVGCSRVPHRTPAPMESSRSATTGP